jgi:hypothetical protein
MKGKAKPIVELDKSIPTKWNREGRILLNVIRNLGKDFGKEEVNRIKIRMSAEGDLNQKVSHN